MPLRIRLYNQFEDSNIVTEFPCLMELNLCDVTRARTPEKLISARNITVDISGRNITVNIFCCNLRNLDRSTDFKNKYASIIKQKKAFKMELNFFFYDRRLFVFEAGASYKFVLLKWDPFPAG